MHKLMLVGVGLSVFLLVFTLGLRASHEDATYLLQRPGLLARCIFVAILAALFDFTPAVKIVLRHARVWLRHALAWRYGDYLLCGAKAAAIIHLIACQHPPFEIDNVNCSNRRGSNVGVRLFRA